MSDPIPTKKLEPKARERLHAEIRRKFWEEHMTVRQIQSAMWKGGYEISTSRIYEIVGPIPKSRRAPRGQPEMKRRRGAPL